jgi:hypothetical protein
VGDSKKKRHEGNGQHPPPLFDIPSTARVEPDPEPLRVREKHALVRDVKAWTAECGLMGELDISEPTVVVYPVRGHGYAVTLREADGKKRMATARYTSTRERSYWSMDGARR